MAKTWKEVFADAQSYPDDFVISAKDKDGSDVTFRLGDARSYDQEHKGQLVATLTRKEQELTARESALNQATQQFGDLIGEFEKTTGESVASLSAKLQKGQRVTKQDVAGVSGLREDDPLVGDVVKQINAFKSEYATERDAYKKQIDGLMGVLGSVGQVAINDHYAREYERGVSSLNLHPKVKDKALKDLTMEKALETAKTKGYVDPQTKVLRVSDALNELSRSYVIESEAERRVEERMRDVEKERRAAAMAPPSMAGRGIPKPAFDVSKSKDPIADAFAAALQDDDVLRSVVGAT